MATAEHCLYCFEVLDSHFQRREPMSLAQVQESYAEYVRSLEEGARDAADAASHPAKRSPALQRLTTSASASSAPSSSSSSSASSPASQPVSGRDTPATSVSSLAPDAASERRPLFVTWNTTPPSPRRRPGGHELRGCIGTFAARELADGLAEKALEAALEDERFDPVAAAELPRLQAAVTLLTDFEDAAGPDDWVVGTHGLRISFVYHGRLYGATYLPDVPRELGWTKEETLVSLMRKAGWMGRKDRWRDVELRVVRYQGKKESVDYAEYAAWREWVDGKVGK